MDYTFDIASYATNAFFGIPLWVIGLILIWVAAWKGVALWKSARKKHIVWFIILLVVNTLGILEILYVFIFSEIGRRRHTPEITHARQAAKTRAPARRRRR